MSSPITASQQGLYPPQQFIAYSTPNGRFDHQKFLNPNLNLASLPGTQIIYSQNSDLTMPAPDIEKSADEASSVQSEAASISYDNVTPPPDEKKSRKRVKSKKTETLEVSESSQKQILNPIRIQLIGPALLPIRNYGDAFDAYLPADLKLEPGQLKRVSLEFKLCLPEDWCAKIIGRSSLTSNRIIVHHSLIDSSYRGICFCMVHNLSDTVFYYEKNSRICQIMFEKVRHVSLWPTDCVTADTDRGERANFTGK